MTADRIESKIVFWERKLPDGGILIEAKLELIQSIKISELVRANPEVITDAKAMAKEHLLRDIYADQRNALHDAIMQLRMCQPWDYDAIQKAHENLLQIARRQEPKPIEP